MSIFTENQEPMFASKEHYEFFKQTCERLNADCYLAYQIPFAVPMRHFLWKR